MASRVSDRALRAGIWRRLRPRPYLVTLEARDTGRRRVWRLIGLDPWAARRKAYDTLDRLEPGDVRRAWRVVAIREAPR